MKTNRTATVLFAIAIALVLTTAAHAETYPKIKGIYVKIQLGSRQMAKHIEYIGARMTSKNEIVYSAKVDGQPRSVIYAFNESGRTVSVTVAGGTAPLAYQALVKNESLKEVQLQLKSSGKTIATTSFSIEADGKFGPATGLYYDPTDDFDPLSMDVLLHLPSEFAGTRPQELFHNEVIEEPKAIGGVAKTVLDILTLGMKYSRDCETTTSGPTYTCSGACTAPPGDAACACSMCGTFCCGGSCTQTEGTTTRNCSAAVSVGAK